MTDTTDSSDRASLLLRRRQFMLAGGAGVLGMLLAPAIPWRALAAGDTKAMPDLKTVKANLAKLKVGEFNPNYVTQWTYRLATSLGYMQDVGITDIETVLSDEYIPGLVGGSLDLSHGDTSVFLGSAHASGLPIKIINIFRDREYWIMGVRKGIDKPEDLKGAKISGGKLDGRNTWVMKQVVKSLGLDPDKDVTFVPTSGGSDNRLKGVISGTLDAASMFPRHRAALEAAGGKFISQTLHQAPQEAFGTMGGWLAKNENTAYAWTLADLKARQWLFNPANKERAYKIMRDYGYDIPPEFEALYQVELDQLSSDGGFESAEAMDQFVADLAETGELPKGMDWRKVVDMTYVWAAQEALGLPKRPKSL